MLIIAGYAIVADSRRDAYVTAHTDLVERCRRAPGCLDAAISADPVDHGRVNILERWESQAALDAWREAADAPDTGIAFDAHVQLYTVTMPAHRSTPERRVGGCEERRSASVTGTASTKGSMPTDAASSHR